MRGQVPPNGLCSYPSHGYEVGVSHTVRTHEMLITGSRTSYFQQIRDDPQWCLGNDDVEAHVQESTESEGVLVINGQRMVQSELNDEREVEEQPNAMILYGGTEEVCDAQAQQGELAIADSYRQPITLPDNHQLAIAHQPTVTFDAYRDPNLRHHPDNQRGVANGVELVVSGHLQLPVLLIPPTDSPGASASWGDNLNRPGRNETECLADVQ